MPLHAIDELPDRHRSIFAMLAGALELVIRQSPDHRQARGECAAGRERCRLYESHQPLSLRMLEVPLRDPVNGCEQPGGEVTEPFERFGPGKGMREVFCSRHEAITPAPVAAFANGPRTEDP